MLLARPSRAFTVALVAAALGTGLLYLYLERFERAMGGGPRVPVLVVAEALRRGQALTEAQLGVRDIPQAYVEERFVLASDRAKVLGLRLAGPARAQQTLLWTDLALENDAPPDVSTLVPPGNRAMTVRVGTDDAAALIHPGDFVDVLANLPGSDPTSRTAVVLLQRVTVIAVGNRTAADAPPVGAAASLTLSVTLHQAQVLTLAAEQGTLQAVLRHPDDAAVAADASEVGVSSLTGPVRRAAPVSALKGPIRLHSEAR